MGNFDIDLDFGQVYEKKITKLLKGDGTIEVKTERDIWAETGNAVFEIMCNGKLSGISTTDARWWCHVFTVESDVKFILFIEVSKLRKLIKYLFLNDLAHIKMGGDNNKSKLVLVRVSELVRFSNKI
mgnify:CR=1 FL=1|tara:strand:+ start:170 stop:550 length:381 start_codon:yes stop_codon:yes gene_type:complete